MCGRGTALSQGPDSQAGAEALVSRLSGDRYNGYVDQPIPSVIDEDAYSVVQAYLKADPQGRAALVQHTIGEPWEVLEIFAQRQAVVAVRTGSLEPIRLGLVAVGMAVPHGDYRYVLNALSKLDYSARLLGEDLADVFKDVGPILPEESTSFIGEFLTAEDRRDDMLLKGMGYAPKGSGQEFTYVLYFPYDDDDA
jgi:hypothetical protein